MYKLAGKAQVLGAIENRTSGKCFCYEMQKWALKRGRSIAPWNDYFFIARFPPGCTACEVPAKAE
jgi:hypothetical protein